MNKIRVGRPRKHAQGEAPTSTDRGNSFVERLVAAGGKRRSYNWRPDVVAALDLLKASRPFDDETHILSEVILRAAELVQKQVPVKKKNITK